MVTSFTFVIKALQIKSSRFFIAVSGIALSTLLVLSLVSALRSATQAFTSYIAQPGADLWIAPQGTDNLVRSSSIMPISYRDEILKIPGVKKADAILKSFVTVKPMTSIHRDKRLTLLGIVYMAPEGLGGPPLFVSGKPPLSSGEVVLDQGAAKKLGVNIHDKVLVNGKTKVVTGLTSGTNLIVTHFLFNSYDDLDILNAYNKVASFFVVSVDSNYKLASVAENIRERLPDVDVFEQPIFIENNRQETSAGYITILSIVYILGITAASVLVALIIYGIIEEKRKEMAVLLALGISEVWIWGALGWGGLRLNLIGCLTGTVLTLFFSYFLAAFYPVIPLGFVFTDVIKLMILLSASNVVATSIPILMLRRIDPLEAFHS